MTHLRWVVPVMVLFMVTAAQATAQEAGTRNAAWTISDGKVVITYDLIVPDDNDYEVTVILRRESDPAFSLLPVSITGDAGKHMKPGIRKTVVWDFRKDVQAPLAGTDYYFEFKIVVLERSSTSWWWYVGGGAVVAGVTAVLLLQKSDPPPPDQPTALPDPPRERPTN